MLDELFFKNKDETNFGGMSGISIGVVKDNWDKKQQGKIKVEYYLGEQGKMVSRWVPVMSPYASSKCGMYFLPEIGSRVILAFEYGRFDCPIVLGSLWQGGAELPEGAADEKNKFKTIKTKSGHEIKMSDEEDKGEITVTTAGGISIFMDDEKESIVIKDKENKNTISLDGKNGELNLNAEKKIVLSIGGTAALTIENNKAEINSGSISISGSQNLKLNGQTTAVSGSQLQIKADASLKVESGAMLELKGTMVKIN